MYAISFRIAIDVMGQRTYINGSALGPRLKKGEIIAVADKRWSNGINPIDAEVVDTASTRRDEASFAWRIVE